jgi:hypothetical protein
MKRETRRSVDKRGTGSLEGESNDGPRLSVAEGQSEDYSERLLCIRQSFLKRFFFQTSRTAAYVHPRHQWRACDRPLGLERTFAPPGTTVAGAGRKTQRQVRRSRPISQREAGTSMGGPPITIQRRPIQTGIRPGGC